MARHEVTISESVGVSASIGMTHIAKTVYTRHPVKFPIIVLLALISPLVGLGLAGAEGVVVGFALSFASLWMGNTAVRAEVVKTIYPNA